MPKKVMRPARFMKLVLELAESLGGSSALLDLSR
jgi:hypothetical protein